MSCADDLTQTGSNCPALDGRTHAQAAGEGNSSASGEGDDGGSGPIDVDIDGSEIGEEIVNQLEPILPRAFEDGVTQFLTGVNDSIASFFEGILEALLTPLIGTPAPRGPSSGAVIDIAFQKAVNAPWNTLVQDFYYKGVLGLALGIQFLTLAAVGLRYKSMNPAVRQKVGRRLFLSFLSIFLWLPLASLAGQVFNALGRQILLAGINREDVVNILVSATSVASDTSIENESVIFVMLLIGVYVYFKAAFIAISRWIMLIVLALCMPLVASFWALEVWPFNRFSGTAAQVAGTYPGLLAAGIPPAVILRISVTASEWGLPATLSVFVTLVTLYIAAKSQKVIIARSSNVALQVSEQVLGGTKKGIKTPAKIGAAATAAGATLGATAATGGAATPAAAAGGAKTAAKGTQTAARGVSKTAAKARTVSAGIGTATNVAKGNVGRSAAEAYRLRLGREQSKRLRDEGEDGETDQSTPSDTKDNRRNGTLEPVGTGPFPDDGDDGDEDDESSPAPPVSGGGGDPPDSASQSNSDNGTPANYFEALNTGTETSTSPNSNGQRSLSPAQSGSSSTPNGSSVTGPSPSDGGARSQSTSDSDGGDSLTPNDVLAESSEYTRDQNGNWTKSSKSTGRSDGWDSLTPADGTQQDSAGQSASDEADSERSTDSSFDELFANNDGPLGPDAYRDPDARIDYQDTGGSDK